MVYGIVYLIMNLVNGKKYVGQTVRSLEKRMLQHTYDNLCVDKAMRKYELENFYYGVVKSCASKEELVYWEKYFIVALKSKVPNGYNLTDGGEGTVGRKHTPETLAKMSASKLGKKRSAETRAKISVSRKGKYTTHHSPKTCAKISAMKRSDSPFKNLLREMNIQQISYRQLAKLMGWSSHASVSRRIRGEYKFSAKDKLKLIEIFGKPIEYLLQRDA